MGTHFLDIDIQDLALKFVDCNVKTSEVSISELRAVIKYLRDRVKEIDKLSEDDSLGYKRLERLADERYRISRELPGLEDALIAKRRNSADFSSVAYNGGGIYTDVSTLSVTNRTGKAGKVRLRGISI